MSTPCLRVLIVDDSALYRQAITASLQAIADVEVIGTARDGRDAIEKIGKLSPDIMTLDVEMPVLNGIETLREMNRLRIRTPTIMVSSLTQEGTKVTLDALFEGAFDFISKPTGGLIKTRDALQLALSEKLDAFRVHQANPGKTNRVRPARRTANADRVSVSPVLESSQPKAARSPAALNPATAKPTAVKPAASNGCRLVVIGTSTGGPQALRFVLPRFDADFPVPIVVVQHMPADYTGMMATRMNEVCQLPVVEASDGLPIMPGSIYLAPGGQHMKLHNSSRRIVTQLTDDEPENSCRPAVDYTLRSAIDTCDGELLAVIMTGMGKDGMVSCQLAKSRGGTVFTQDATSSAVYGMPKAVVDAGVSDRELPLGKIAAAITRHVNRNHRIGDPGGKNQ